MQSRTPSLFQPVMTNAERLPDSSLEEAVTPPMDPVPSTAQPNVVPTLAPPAKADGLLVSEREAAEMLTISPRKLWELRNRGDIPCVRFGRAVRYDPDDLKAWIKERKSTR